MSGQNKNPHSSESINNAIIIGGAIIASAIVFGTFVALSRNNHQPSLTALPSPIAPPTPEAKVTPAPSPSLAVETGIATSTSSPELMTSPPENSRPAEVVPAPVQSIVSMPSKFEPARSIALAPKPLEQSNKTNSPTEPKLSTSIVVNKTSTYPSHCTFLSALNKKENIIDDTCNVSQDSDGSHYNLAWSNGEVYTIDLKNNKEAIINGKVAQIIQKNQKGVTIAFLQGKVGWELK